MSTEIYSFRSGDKSPNSPNRAMSTTHLQNVNSPAIKPLSSAREDINSALIIQNNATPVGRDDLLNAVNDILKSIDLSLEENFEDVLKKNLVIRDELEHKDQYTKSLEDKIEVMEKDINKAMDAFLCPITRVSKIFIFYTSDIKSVLLLQEVMSDPVICAGKFIIFNFIIR